MSATHWEGPPLEAWDAWRPEAAAERLAGLAAPWCVVGGWAIDLWLGEETRAHGDLEIAVVEADFPAVRRALAGYRLFLPMDGSVRALADNAAPPADCHQTWVMEEAAQAWRLDVFREPGDARTWVYRRDPSLTRPRAEMEGRTTGGIRFLRPEGVLFYKAKATRPKDEADFTVAAPRMDGGARAWLRAALERFHPGHAWIARLGV